MSDRPAIPPPPPGTTVRQTMGTLGTSSVGNTAEGRAIMANPDGSFSTERSITIQTPDGRWTNIPSMFGGKQLGERAASDIMRRNNWVDPETGRPAEFFSSVQEAETAARARSNSIPTKPQIGLPQTPLPSSVPAPPPGTTARQVEPSVGEQLTRGFSGVASGFMDQMQGTYQGTAPMVRNDKGELIRPWLGYLEETPDGFYISNPEAKKQWPVDPNKHVVLKDPQDGLMKVFQRTPDTDERVAAVGRLVGLGATSTAPGRIATAPGWGAKGSQLTQDMIDLGVRPNLAATSGNRAVQGTLQGGMSNPVTAGPVSRAVQQGFRETGEAAETVASRYGTASTPFEAGRAVQKGAQEFVTRFQQRAGKLYDRFFMQLPQGTPIKVEKTLDALTAPGTRFDNPELGALFVDPRFSKWREIIEKSQGVLSLNDLKALRTEVGGMIARPQIVNDIPRSELNRVYAALSDDMAKAAAATPGASRALERANNFYRGGLARIDDALAKILKPGTSEENAYQMIMSTGQGKGARASQARLQAIKKSLNPDEWNEVAATVLRRLGDPVASATSEALPGFSVSSFMTNYSKLSPGAKNTLFGGAHSKLRKQLDKLVNVISAQKDVERLANTSGTGMVGSAGLLGAAFITDPITTILGSIGGNAAARLLMNPRFVGWLNVLPGQRTSAQWLRHMASLEQLRRQNPELSDPITSIMQQINPPGGQQ